MLSFCYATLSPPLPVHFLRLSSPIGQQILQIVYRRQPKIHENLRRLARSKKAADKLTSSKQYQNQNHHPHIITITIIKKNITNIDTNKYHNNEKYNKSRIFKAKQQLKQKKTEMKRKQKKSDTNSEKQQPEKEVVI